MTKKNEGYFKTLQFRVSITQLRYLSQQSKKHDVTISDVIRQAINLAMESGYETSK